MGCLFHGLARVGEQVDEHLGQLVAVERHARHVLERAHDLHPPALRAGLLAQVQCQLELLGEVGQLAQVVLSSVGLL